MKSVFLNKTFAFYFVIVSYILVNIYIFLFKNNYFYHYNLIPFGLLIIFIALVDIEKIMYILVFCTPLTITLKDLGISDGLNLSLPSEPLMIGITLVYLLNELAFSSTDKKLLKHPLTIIILIQVVWMAITITTSELPVISTKTLLARLWFITSSYFFVSMFFKKQKAILAHLLCYAVPLTLIVIITLFKHRNYNFDEKSADWIVSPFFNDHTSYGAMLAMYIPVLIGIMFLKNVSVFVKACCFVMLSIFFVGLVYSYARAGWLSLAIALVVFIIIILKVNLKYLFIIIGAILLILITFQSEIIMRMNKNSVVSDGDFQANLNSITNITTDVSNLERLNRWGCAVRIFEAYPYFGSGPGTYQFLYAPFQKSSQKTVISTNYGNKGNAHSEYLGPLCEQGIVGLLIMMSLTIYIIILGFKIIRTTNTFNIYVLSICIFLGIITYLAHGFLNNFLDTDKASVPFWGFLAMLVCIDLYQKNIIESAHK